MMDATTKLLAFGGLSAVVVALLAWRGDHRRFRRRDLDAVGVIPWTPIFFAALLVAITLLGLAWRAWLGG